ncbi:MAG: TfoX/Sxy family protein [Deltaproteobacteria bacterium]|nr:TfoX/Sxy family protein [Deltaproteobacteria bacterium]
MPYDQDIDSRIRKAVSGWKGVSSKKMFGGVCHLLNGNMVGGVYKDYMILRLGTEEAERALRRKHVKEFDITGKAMKGWVMVEKEGFITDQELGDWLRKAERFVKTLPPK